MRGEGRPGGALYNRFPRGGFQDPVMRRHGGTSHVARDQDRCSGQGQAERNDQWLCSASTTHAPSANGTTPLHRPANQLGQVRLPFGEQLARVPGVVSLEIRKRNRCRGAGKVRHVDLEGPVSDRDEERKFSRGTDDAIVHQLRYERQSDISQGGFPLEGFWAVLGPLGSTLTTEQ